MKQRLQRAWAFGRHIPPGKLVRRAKLSLQRKQADKQGVHLPPCPDVTLRDDLPIPVFPPRLAGQVRRDGDALVFCFLGREERFDGGRIDWMAPGSGGEHQLWRMNLQYMEYLEEVDDTLFAQLVEAWLEGNDALKPGAWRDGWNAYALSIRVVVWMQQLAARQGRIEAALVARMGDSIARQLAYLARHLETDIGGNHLAKNIKALLWAGACFDGAGVRDWQALGVKLLNQELAIQVLTDGVHYERSPSYHTQVLCDFLECRAVLPAPIPVFDDALVRMAQATADLAHPDGLCAQFNDAGLRMAYAPKLCLDAFAAQTGTRPDPRADFAYKDAGYFGYRNGAMTVIADCGALAPDDLPAHGHGDILSFEMSLGNERLFVDQGVFEYIPGERRAASRRAASHNTLWIEGTDQADFFGAFRFGRRPRIRKADWAVTNTGATLTGAHDGYATAPGAPLHQRRFNITSDSLSIRDEIAATVPQTAGVSFLLHPDVIVTQTEAGLNLTTASGHKVTLTCTAPITIDPAVWWPDMGTEVPSLRLTAQLAPGCTEVDTHIHIVAAATTINFSKV